ncbi:hypothetical protein PENTCL1PPCAC_12582, partial [Pristionchus entomophagus]
SLREAFEKAKEAHAVAIKEANKIIEDADKMLERAAKDLEEALAGERSHRAMEETERDDYFNILGLP